jgi:hypothetical protein
MLLLITRTSVVIRRLNTVHYVCKAPRAGMLLLITRTSVVIRRLNAVHYVCKALCAKVKSMLLLIGRTSVVIRRLNAALIPRLPLNK